MTTDDLRAAAEFLLRDERDDACEHIWNAHQQCQWCHRMRRDVHANGLARAYLAGRSEDDGDPVTCQRLVDAGFVEGKFRRGRDKHRYFSMGVVKLKQECSGETPVRWVLFIDGNVIRGVKAPNTMGQVRRLIAALKGE